MDTSTHLEETPVERRARELFARIVSYSYLNERGLLVEPPHGPLESGITPMDDPEPDDHGGPPYAAAMAMPTPEEEVKFFLAYPACTFLRKHAR